MVEPTIPQAVHVRAPGKINLYLGVGERHDDGYHDLRTVFQAVSLYEDVVATHADDFSVTVLGAGPAENVPTDDRNLAMRAAKLLAAHAGYTGGAHLSIRKSVPVAGGMGGGSADAAATLIALDQLWGLGLPTSELHELAAQLGADVPFALYGGTALGTGRGDELQPALATGRFDWVLLRNTRGLSTPDVYRRLDELRDERGYDLPETADAPCPMLQALRSGVAEDLAEALHNDLQEAACDLRPELADTIRHGIVAGGLNAIVSGSGPTVAVLCSDEEHALVVVERLREVGLQAQHVYGPAHGTRVISGARAFG